MRKRFLGMNTAGVLIILALFAPTFMGQRPRSKPAGPAPPPAQTTGDLKLTYKMTTSGQSMEMTTMIKGARERTETRAGYGMDMVNLTQCDLKRTIQISDKTRKYVITPMETVEATPITSASGGSVSPSRRGGVITYTINTVDTGERKEMFGFKARHVKTSTTMESSPDACSPFQMRMETDGWYIDFSAAFSCDTGRAQTASPPVSAGGCRDRVQMKRTGTGRTGYALIETTTGYGPNGNVTYTTTREVVELSREPLDAALFDIPAGYVETQNSQDLYGTPSMASVAQMSPNQAGEDSSSNASGPANSKAPGTIRVGVVQINNRSDRQVSTESLRGRLIGNIEGNGIDAVPLNASSMAEAEAEARLKQCDFILFTDIGALKTSAARKVGGVFGRAAGVSGIDKTEAKLEFKLFAVGETSPRLQSGATAKEEGDEASAGTAIDQEAKMVSAEVRKSRG